MVPHRLHRHHLTERQTRGRDCRAGRDCRGAGATGHVHRESRRLWRSRPGVRRARAEPTLPLRVAPLENDRPVVGHEWPSVAQAAHERARPSGRTQVASSGRPPKCDVGRTTTVARSRRTVEPVAGAPDRRLPRHTRTGARRRVVSVVWPAAPLRSASPFERLLGSAAASGGSRWVPSGRGAAGRQFQSELKVAARATSRYRGDHGPRGVDFGDWREHRQARQARGGGSRWLVTGARRAESPTGSRRPRRDRCQHSRAQLCPAPSSNSWTQSSHADQPPEIAGCPLGRARLYCSIVAVGVDRSCLATSTGASHGDRCCAACTSVRWLTGGRTTMDSLCKRAVIVTSFAGTAACHRSRHGRHVVAATAIVVALVGCGDEGSTDGIGGRCCAVAGLVSAGRIIVVDDGRACILDRHGGDR